jgi:hypothetical protein
MNLRAYIEERSMPVPFSGCWLWIPSLTSAGYGNLTAPFPPGRDRPTRLRMGCAHRVSFVAFKGKIPSGLVLDA